MIKTVVFNQKGGVGKSTITCNLAAISAQQGRKTLVIDLDSQANASQYLLGESALSLEETLYGFYDQVLNFSYVAGGLKRFIHPSAFNNLAVLPACAELEHIQSKCEARHKIYKLRDALQERLDYDQVFFDTPPALNFFSRSALIAANQCLVPFDCDSFAQKAIEQLLQNLREIQDDHNPELSLGGIVVNQFSSQAKLPSHIVQELIDAELPVLSPYLSSSIKVKESHQAQLPLVHFAPKHKLTLEFLQLYEQIFAPTINSQSKILDKSVSY